MEFKSINKFKKYLGIDYGRKRIGLALGDSEIKIATPFKIVNNIEEIIKIIKNEEINELIIGQPLKMRGRNLKMDNDFLEFLEILKEKVAIPIKLIDERLSSKAADALSGDKRTKAPRDTLAAMLILQTYFDKNFLVSF